MTAKRAIGGKGLNSGIRGGLWDVKHYGKMGDALWLFGWLVHRQTTQRNGEGLVLRGKCLTYAAVSDDTGFAERTLRRWMGVLRREGYVSVKHGSYKQLVVRVLNAKKFAPRQLELLARETETVRPIVADMKPSIRPEVADLIRPTVADIAAKSGRFKEGTEIEHKHLGRGAADAAEKSSAAQTAAVPTSQSLPACIPVETWLAYLDMRKRIRRPLTDHGTILAIRKLLELQAEGHAPQAVLEHSILNSYQGLFPPNGKGGSRAAERTRNNLRSAEFVQ